MEQPLYRNQLDPNNPFNGESGSVNQNREHMRHAAGQIVLHETPHTGEIALNAKNTDAVPPQQQGAAFRPVHLPRAAVASVEAPEQLSEAPMQAPTKPVEFSAWHNTTLDNESYGQAFHNERAKENLDNPQVDTFQHTSAAPVQPAPADAAQPAAQQQQLTQDANKHYVAPPAATPANPLYGVMPHPQHTTTAAQVMQPLEQNPTFTQPPVQPVNMQGALNPSQPIAPLEPRLPVGQPAPIDPQHRLPAPRSIIKRIAQNPVVWLAVGVAMIFYFGRSLF